MAQATTAARGQIPRHALAYGVEVNGNDVRLRFQVTEVTDEDLEDMVDAVSELEALVGSAVRVTYDYEVRTERVITPRDGVRWIFLQRVDPEVYGSPDPAMGDQEAESNGGPSPLTARALVQASDFRLTVHDVDELVLLSLRVKNAALRRSLGMGLVCELVMDGYVEVEMPDALKPDDTSAWGLLKAVWHRWEECGLFAPGGQSIAEFPLTPAGWEEVIRLGSMSGIREFVWDGTPYESAGRWRIRPDA